MSTGEPQVDHENPDGQPSEEEPFDGACVVEFGDDYNRTITLNTIKQPVRGKFSLVNLAKRKEGAADYIGKMAGMPDIPGMRLGLDFRKQKYKLYDPLARPENASLLKQINAVYKKGVSGGAEFGPVETQMGEMNDDQWKTLLIELVNKKEAKCLRVVDGRLPTIKQIAKMKGRRLADPWNSSKQIPTYHDELPAYAEKLDARG